MIAMSKEKTSKSAAPGPCPTLQVAISSIAAHPHNAREQFDEIELKRLAESLKDNGLVQPVVLRPTTKSKYELVAGERRLRAATMAGWKKIPAIVREMTDAECLVLGLVENLQRVDLNPLEKARGLERLCAPVGDGGGGKTQAEASAMFGHEKQWATRLIGLLRLPECWQARIVAGELLESHARILVPYADNARTLQAIEADMLNNPWAYRTREDFQRNVELVVNGAAGNGTKVDDAVRRPMPKGGGKGHENRRLSEEDGPAPALKIEMAKGGGPESRLRVREALMAIEALRTSDELNQVANAIDARRRQIEASA